MAYSVFAHILQAYSAKIFSFFRNRISVYLYNIHFSYIEDFPKAQELADYPFFHDRDISAGNPLCNPHSPCKCLR